MDRMERRKLNSLQKFYYYRSSLNVHSCIFLAVKLNELPSQEELIPALRKVVLDHPEFHCNIFQDQETEELYVGSLENTNICFEDIIEYVSWIEGDKCINNIFKKYKFEYHVQKPLWKILIDSEKRELIFVANHILFDGMSCVEFWKIVLKYLNNDLERNNYCDSVLYHSQDDASSVPDVHPYDYWPLTWKSMIMRPILGILFRWFPDAVTGLDKKSFQFKGYSFPDGLLVNNKNNESTGYEIRNDNCQYALRVPQDKLSNILYQCKSKNVSLTSFLAAAVCTNLKESIDEKDFTGTIFKIDIPMNTRGACGSKLQISEAKLRFGNLVAPLELQYDISKNENIWEVAKQFQGEITRQVYKDIDTTINNVKLLEVVNEHDFVKQKINTTGPPGTFEITNLGFQSFSSLNDTMPRFEVLDATFNEPQSVSDMFTCAVISTPKGGLNCSISFPRDVQSEFQKFTEKIDQYFSSK